MRQQDRDGGVLHDMAGHAAEEKLPVMAVGVCAHDDEPGPNRAGLGKQAWSGRLIGRKACRGDAMPAQVAQQLLGIGVMLALGCGKYLDAALELAKEREREMHRASRLAASVPGDEWTMKDVCRRAGGDHEGRPAGLEQCGFQCHGRGTRGASPCNQDEIAEPAEPRDHFALISEDVPPLCRRPVRGDTGIEKRQLALCMPRIEVLAGTAGGGTYARLNRLGQQAVGDTRMALVLRFAAGIEAHM
jgi:hypothetical protein